MMNDIFLNSNVKYHIVYKTTNLINGKWYIGKHSTYNLNDGYLGSSQHLKSAIKKYGKENFQREIICFCNSEEEAYAKEAELVTMEVVNDPNSYNKMPGGEGGQKRFTDEEIKEHHRENFRKWREVNLEHRREYNRENKRKWREANREYDRERKRKWREDNREHEREYKREYACKWRKNNCEHVQEYQREWRNANRDKINAKRRARYAEKKLKNNLN